MEYEIGSTESISGAVLEAIQMCGRRESARSRSLDEVVDTDALDDLFAPLGDGSPRPGGRVSFIHENHRVVVHNGEFIELNPLAKRTLTCEFITPSRRPTGSASRHRPP